MSSFATINGVSINHGSLRFAIAGTWEAKLSVSTNDPLAVSGLVSLQIADRVLVGTSTVATADLGGLVTVRVVGGRGGLAAAVVPRAYIATTRGTLLADALAAGKETISPLSDSSLLLAPVVRWTRVQDTVGGAVKRILASTSASWRILADGSFWFGSELWLPVTPDAKIESESPNEKRLTLALESLSVMPGDTYAGHRVTSVDYSLDDRRLRADVSYADTRSGLAGQLSDFVRRELATVDLMRSYAAQVVGQNGDGTLEIKLEDPRVPHLSRVPARLGIPGVTGFTVAPGTRCLLTHENGDEQRPVVTSFGSTPALSIKIEAPSVSLGLPASAAQSVALSNLVLAELAKIAATLATGSASGNPVVFASPYVPGSVAAATVKAV